ncbi:MAG: hypothetical protein HEP71_13695 [Roseivirga sp.]|nr:hypothetical protein [Roseivirga sp.]
MAPQQLVSTNVEIFSSEKVTSPLLTVLTHKPTFQKSSINKTMEEISNQSTLDQLAAQRHREMVANETIYNSEEERAKAIAAATYPFQGSLKFTMPFPGTTQVSGTLKLLNGPSLKITGSLQGFGFTGEASLPYISGYFSTDPSDLTSVPLWLTLKKMSPDVPQMELDIYNLSYAPVGRIATSVVMLLPFRELIGQVVLQQS